MVNMCIMNTQLCFKMDWILGLTSIYYIPLAVQYWCMGVLRGQTNHVAFKVWASGPKMTFFCIIFLILLLWLP